MKSAVSKVYTYIGRRIRNSTPTICRWISSISVFFLNRNVHRLQLTGGSPIQLHRYTHRRELRKFTIQERFTLHSIRIQSRPHSADEHQQNITQDQNLALKTRPKKITISTLQCILAQFQVCNNIHSYTLVYWIPLYDFHSLIGHSLFNSKSIPL